MLARWTQARRGVQSTGCGNCARIVYVSCNPKAAARDVRWLTDHGYAIERIRPVDLFPHTPHVECVIGLRRADVPREP